VLVASTPTDKDKQAGTSGHFRICAGAEPTAANRVRPYPHCPSSGARRSPSVDDGGVSSRCMGGCRLWGSGGGAVAVASRHGRGGPVGTATASVSWVFDSRLALVTGGLATALFVSMPVGRGRPRGGFVLGVWAGVAAHLAVGGAAAIPRSGAGPHRGQRAGRCRPCPAAVLLGPAILVAVSSVAAYGSQCLSVAGLAVAGRHSGRFFCTVSVAFWPVGGPSCAAGEVQHGEGWPWRQSVAGDPGARTTWCSAC
jgi:hypothetical protein